MPMTVPKHQCARNEMRAMLCAYDMMNGIGDSRYDIGCISGWWI